MAILELAGAFKVQVVVSHQLNKYTFPDPIEILGVTSLHNILAFRKHRFVSTAKVSDSMFPTET
jgi:hypothetical protein